MEALRMDIVRRDNSDFELTFTDVDGNPIDLDKCTVFFTVKRRKEDADEDAVLAKQITSFEDSETGICILALDSDETDLIAGGYWFDVQLKDTLGRFSSSRAGRLVVKQDITIRTALDSEFS